MAQEVNRFRVRRQAVTGPERSRGREEKRRAAAATLAFIALGLSYKRLAINYAAQL